LAHKLAMFELLKSSCPRTVADLVLPINAIVCSFNGF
jgi:hypothetical protein